MSVDRKCNRARLYGELMGYLVNSIYFNFMALESFAEHTLDSGPRKNEKG